MKIEQVEQTEQFRTNFFDYRDKKLINNIALRHDVLATSNMKGVSLIGSKSDILSTLDESFEEEPSIHIEDDVILVNLI